MIPNNAQIRTVSRMGAFDRYGQGRLETVYSELWGRLDTSPRSVIDGNGTTVTIDATLVLEAQYVVLPGDEIALESARAEKYKVYNVTEIQDLLGVVLYRQLRLVKQIQGLE